MATALRCVLALCVAVAAMAAERTTPLTREDLLGRWEPAVEAIDEKTRAAAAEALKPGDDRWHIALMSKYGRLYFGQQPPDAGMWRLDEATPTSAVIVIQPAGREERRLKVAFDGTTLTPEGLPWKLPFRKAKQ